MIASAAIAAAQPVSDVCFGVNAIIGGSCTPLTNTITGDGANTALGVDALTQTTEVPDNTSGFSNTAVGFGAISANTSGSENTAVGADALQNDVTGNENTAIGLEALAVNLSSANTAIGGFAGTYTTGSADTILGAEAGAGSGSFNISVGFRAGENLKTGSSNIDIGNAGLAADSNVIRIGDTQTKTLIAGIFNSPGTKKACEVVVQSTGRLDCMASSARYKHDIRDMGDASDKLMKLRPVTFQYKEDSTGTREYGLIAEEVEKVYPELVIDGSDGKAQTVAYQELPAMLLNEVQKERRQLAQKDAEIAAMRRQLAALQKKNGEIDAMAERLDALERQARASRSERIAAAQ